MRELVRRFQSEGRLSLSELETKRLIQGVGVPVPASGMARTREEAVGIAGRLDYPVVMKLVSPKLTHRSDSGAVILGLRDSNAVAAAFDRLAGLARDLQIDMREDGVLVERMVSGGVEVIIGIRRDPILGSFLVFGAGGVLTELLKQTSIRRLPIDRSTALEMVKETRVSQLLSGYRGGPPHDIDALLNLMQAVSRFATGLGNAVAELELNPVIVGKQGEGAWAVDALARLNEASAAGEDSEVERAHEDAQHAVGKLLQPSSIAVVGASEDPGKFGNWLLQYLLKHGTKARLHPVNPKSMEILGLRCHPNVQAIPETVDVACFFLPAEFTPPAVKQCAAKGIKAGIIFSSGFREIGRQDLEEKTLEAARSGGVRLCGPNTIGVIRPSSANCLSFSNLGKKDRMIDGVVAVISQSGAVGGTIVSRLWELGIGVSLWISAGNEMDLEVSDYLDFAREDSKTKVVILFLEGVKEGDRFLKATACCIRAGKPVIVYKSGKTETGSSAVQSHTGKLAGDHALYSAFFQHCGAIEVDEFVEAVDLVKGVVLSPPLGGNRIAGLSTSGGIASILADEIERSELVLASLGTGTKGRLAELIGAGGHPDNPVDIGGLAFQQPASFGTALRLLLEDHGVDGVILPFTTISEPSASAIADQIIGETSTQIRKPIFAAWQSAVSDASQAYACLNAHIPVYRSTRTAVRVMNLLMLSRNPKCTRRSHGK